MISTAPHENGPVAVCKFCASDQGFREVGEVRCSATRDTRKVTIGDGGVLVSEWDSSPDVDSFCLDSLDDVFEVECRACGATGANLEDIAGSALSYEVGTPVTCPDGLRGVVAWVDFDKKRLRVADWHEEFTFAEVDALVPMVEPLKQVA